MNTWLVNTNSNPNNNNPNGFKFMLRQNKIATFYDRKEEIEKIAIADMILLYHNENRIIAVGFAVEHASHDFEEMSAVESWLDVNWIWKASFDNNYNPINSINRIDIGITSVMRSVNNVTGQVNHKEILSQIGKRQHFFL